MTDPAATRTLRWKVRQAQLAMWPDLLDERRNNPWTPEDQEFIVQFLASNPEIPWDGVDIANHMAVSCKLGNHRSELRT